MTQRTRSLLIATAVLAVALGPATGRAVVVYDNTATVTGLLDVPPSAGPLELGDSVVLAGTERVVTDFELLYGGNFDADGDETVTLRLYQNDGMDGEPGTLLFESDPAPIGPVSFGSQVFVFEDVLALVPDSLTWTVEFEGISQMAPDRARLFFYDPPGVGSGDTSFYWARTASGWEQVMALPGGGNSFYARIVAVPEPGAAAQGVVVGAALVTLAARRRRAR